MIGNKMSGDEQVWRAVRNAFEFGEDDLVENRAGKLTEWQKRGLKEKQKRILRELMFIVPVAIYGVISLPIPVIRVAFTIFAIYILVDMGMQWRHFKHEMHTLNRVEYTQGWATKSKRLARELRYVYRVEVATTAFNITRDQYEVFTEGATYRAYYTPLTRTLVAIEPIE